jgi:two-component system OmpR family response regulator
MFWKRSQCGQQCAPDEQLRQMPIASRQGTPHRHRTVKVMVREDTKPHVLIVEDARDIRDPLARYLREHGYRTTTAADALAARKALRSSGIDLVVLDIMMPGEDGLSLCRSVRESSQIPVILLTARGEEVDRIIGLEMGADDYIAKPFSPRELIARIAAVLRRTQALPPRQRPPEAEHIRFGDWMLDTGQRELIGADGVATALSSGEFSLLRALIERPKISLTRNQLLDLTKGRDAELFDRSIDNHVSRLRRKLEPDPKTPRYIKTVWGGGYMFAVDPTFE